MSGMSHDDLIDARLRLKAQTLDEHAEVVRKKKLHTQMEAEVADFLKRGGAIEVIPQGVQSPPREYGHIDAHRADMSTVFQETRRKLRAKDRFVSDACFNPKKKKS